MYIIRDSVMNVLIVINNNNNEEMQNMYDTKSLYLFHIIKQTNQSIFHS
jgi:hypothetical protein